MDTSENDGSASESANETDWEENNIPNIDYDLISEYQKKYPKLINEANKTNFRMEHTNDMMVLVDEGTNRIILPEPLILTAFYFAHNHV